mgnify:CR=1 FL=1
MPKLPIRVKGLKLNPKTGILEKDATPRKMSVSAKIQQRESKRVRVSKAVKGAQRP